MAFWQNIINLIYDYTKQYKVIAGEGVKVDYRDSGTIVSLENTGTETGKNIFSMTYDSTSVVLNFDFSISIGTEIMTSTGNHSTKYIKETLIFDFPSSGNIQFMIPQGDLMATPFFDINSPLTPSNIIRWYSTTWTGTDTTTQNKIFNSLTGLFLVSLNKSGSNILITSQNSNKLPDLTYCLGTPVKPFLGYNYDSTDGRIHLYHVTIPNLSTSTTLFLDIPFSTSNKEIWFGAASSGSFTYLLRLDTANNNGAGTGLANGQIKIGKISTDSVGRCILLEDYTNFLFNTHTGLTGTQSFTVSGVTYTFQNGILISAV